MLYQEVLGLIPDYWAPMSSDERFLAVPLSDPYSEEYINVKSRLDGNYYHLCNGIYRVQNPLLWAKFILKKYEYQRRGEGQIKTLYHDTSNVNVDSICEYNFDWRLGERFMFGPGVYFSLQPDWACKHSSKKNGPMRAMFVVDVLVQNIQRAAEGVFLPDPGYDTVLAHSDQTYVKYFDGDYYPRYFMTYESRDNLLGPDPYIGFY